MISRPKSNKTNIFLKKSIQPKNKEIINAIQNKGNAYFPNFNDGLYKYINEKNQSIKVEPLNVKITSKLINFFDFQNAIRDSLGEAKAEAPDPTEDPRVRRIKAILI